MASCRVALFLVVVAATAACFPYRETVRPSIAGRVVDAEGAPVPRARVRACAHSKWAGSARCAVDEEVRADDAGRFAFDEASRIEWCCLGEAPLYRTELTMCTEDDRHATLLIEGGGDEVTLTAGAPDDARCVEPPTFERPRDDDDQGERRP